MSNLKQIALGVIQYTQDYDEHFPIYRHGAGTNPDGWASAIEPYLKSAQIFQCPSENHQQSATPSSTYWNDYWINVYLTMNSLATFTLTSPRNVASVEFPAMTAMLGDNGGWSYANEYSMLPASYCGSVNHALLPKPAANIHLEGSNFAFADGHVKWLKGSTAPGLCGTTALDYYASPEIWNQNLTSTTTPAKGTVMSFSP